jgi:Carboxypeptidase regulatory-like domain
MLKRIAMNQQQMGVWAAAVVASGVLIMGATGWSWAQNDEGPTSSLRIVVVRDVDGKPVKNAQVVLHPVNRKGKQTKGEMDLKTDADGRATVDAIPYGSLQVQVLAKGFQTFGEDYEVKQSELEITVKLKRPGGQYSIYENHDNKKEPDQKPQ